MKTRTTTMGLVVWAAAALGLAATAGADSSAIATVLEMRFDGQLTTDFGWNLRSQIEDQLRYTIGSLNAFNSVGRLDKVVLRNVQRTSLARGRHRVTYHAKMPVAWGSKTNLPKSFTFTLPRDVSVAGLEAFSTKYRNSCVDAGAHDVDPGSMWYYYRPRARGCFLAKADIVRVRASVVVSPVNTTGKFPEYNKVWEDGELRVVAIFGKYEDGATTTDAGIGAYNEFLRASKSALLSRGSGYETVPASVPHSPGVSMPIVEQRIQLADGKRVAVFAFLVDNPSAAGFAFDARYEELSGRADLIAYNGHAGLGANVRALARKGSWIAGQYVMVFMNAGDTFAYLDSALFDAHAAINSDDPTGTKYTDVILNAGPAYFSSQSGATMAFLNGLLRYNIPRTYEEIFRDVDSTQVVLVTGEADNTFVPGGGGGPALPIRVQSSVAQTEQKRVATATLAAGHYVVTLAHDPAAPGGDADLYVRIGFEPNMSTYDCRPYKSGSDESCRMTLGVPAELFTLVRGYLDQNAYILTIAAEGGGM